MTSDRSWAGMPRRRDVLLGGCVLASAALVSTPLLAAGQGRQKPCLLVSDSSLIPCAHRMVSGLFIAMPDIMQVPEVHDLVAVRLPENPALIAGAMPPGHFMVASGILRDRGFSILQVGWHQKQQGTYTSRFEYAMAAPYGEMFSKDMLESVPVMSGPASLVTFVAEI